MSRCFIATNQRQTAAKRLVLCFGCVCLSVLAVVWFGLLPKMQAAKNIPPKHQVSTAPTKIQPSLIAGYGKLPLSFEANQGQVSGAVKFLAGGRGYALFLTGDAAVLSLHKATGVTPTGARPDLVGRPAVRRMRVIGANASAAVTGAEDLPGKSNYSIDNNPKKCRTNVLNYAQVKCADVYPGVDLIYYGTLGGHLEYDFVVLPVPTQV